MGRHFQNFESFSQADVVDGSIMAPSHPPSTQQTGKSSSSSSNRTLQDLYFDRLHLNVGELDQEPTLKKLTQIHEAQLEHICFENLSQHGCSFPATLDKDSTIEKILIRKRGGFCLELNLLLSYLLQDLGYKVRLVPAYVAIRPGSCDDDATDPVDDSFRDAPSHVFLIVRTSDCPTPQFCDVGFGEPPLHPVPYEVGGKMFTTVEGMQSRFISRTEYGPVYLEWFKDSAWTVRLKWSSSDADSIGGVSGNSVPSHDSDPTDISDVFQPILDRVLVPESIFSQKVICTRLTRSTKRTMAGNKLRVTSPRFGDSKVTISTLASVDEARSVLSDEFGIPLAETQGLKLEASLSAPSQVWEHM